MDRFKVKGAIVTRYGAQYVAARVLEIPESRLSKIINGRLAPNPREATAMRDKLGIEFERVETRKLSRILHGDEAHGDPAA